MRYIKLLVLIFFGYFFCDYSIVTSDTVTCRDVIHQMLDSIKNLNTEQLDIKATERVNGGLLIAESRVKINFFPRKIYFLSPKKGIEILYVEGTNKENAIVHTRSLPLINFDLDPFGSIMRKDQHHTIFELGSQYIGITIANTIVKSPKDFDKHFKYAGIVKFNNIDCYQIMIDYPDYKYIEYVVGKGETVTSIAQKLNTSDYKVRYLNDLSSYFGTIKQGKKLKIPVPYSNKVILSIDKKTFIPLNILVYDEEGLFEGYEFTNVKINPKFATDEFSKSFKNYGF